MPLIHEKMCNSKNYKKTSAFSILDLLWSEVKVAKKYSNPWV
jgi:hypothetical protein